MAFPFYRLNYAIFFRVFDDKGNVVQIKSYAFYQNHLEHLRKYKSISIDNRRVKQCHLLLVPSQYPRDAVAALLLTIPSKVSLQTINLANYPEVLL